MSELHFLTIAQGAALIARRAISPVEWTRALLDRIAALDEQLNAFLQVTGELAIARACDAEREITAGRSRGPLHGVPFALKDLFDTAGIPTTAQSRVAIDRVPTVDAEVTSRLHEAGAVLVGKLAMHEFAHGGPSLDIRGRSRETRGTRCISPAVPAAVPPPRWLPALCRPLWAPIPVARSGFRRACAESRA